MPFFLFLPLLLSYLLSSSLLPPSLTVISSLGLVTTAQQWQSTIPSTYC
jgi:hypothetical protein